MRNKKIAVYLCMGLLFATTGCSNSNADSDVSIADTINFNDVIDTNTEENNSNNQNNKENDDNQSNSNSQGNNGESTNNQSYNSVKNDDSQQNNNKDLVQQSNITQSQADYVQPQADSSQSQIDNAQLQSNFELDGNIESIDDNRVVINKTFHPSENTAVSYGDSEKVLVTVYFSEETEFEVWTVKNGGVNGDTDTEKRQGAFSDLEQGAYINMTGNYDGNDFQVKHVIIYNFV